MAQVLDHHFQIGHMVVGQTLDLLLLADLLVFLLHLGLKLVDPLPGPGQLAVRRFQLLQRGHLLLVIRQIPLVPVAVDIGLKRPLHRAVDARQLTAHTEFPEKFLQGGVNHLPLVFIIEISQIPVLDKSRRNRKVEHPLVIQAINPAVHLHEILKEPVDVAGPVSPVGQLRNRPKDLGKFRRHLEGTGLVLRHCKYQVHGLPDRRHRRPPVRNLSPQLLRQGYSGQEFKTHGPAVPAHFRL